MARNGIPMNVERNAFMQFLRKWQTISTDIKGATHVNILVPERNTKNNLVQSKNTNRTRSSKPRTKSLFSGTNLVMITRNMLKP